MVNALVPARWRDKPGASAVAIALITAALVAMPFVVGHLGGNAWVRMLAFAALYTMLALGLNIVVGFAGLLDLGYIAFYAVGAYMYALLASPHLSEHFPIIAQWFPNGTHLPIWFVIPLGAGIAALFGIILGAPVLKLRGDYLAIVTLGFGEIIRIFLNNLNAPLNFTNGPQGITLIDPVSILGLRFTKTQDIFGLQIPSVYLYYYLFVILALLTIGLCMRLQDSRLGRAWMAIREDDIAAKAMGINTRNVKLLAFSLGASFGGVAGAMFAAFQGFVSPESFSLMESILVLAMIVLGGLGHIPGVVVGAIILTALPEVFRYGVPAIRQPILDAVQWLTSPLPTTLSDALMSISKNILEPEILRMLFFGLAMVIIMLYRPKGLWPAPEHGIARTPPGTDPVVKATAAVNPALGAAR